MSGRHIDINSSISLTAAIIINIVGPCVFIVQPGFVQGLVEHMGYGTSAAGYVAAVEMWGIALAALLLAFFNNHLNWRLILRLSALLMIGGNLLSMIVQAPTLFIFARGVVGIGSGSMISLGFTLLGLTRNPDRNFGYMVMWVLLYGAVTMALLPIIFATVGVRGLIALFTLLAAVALFFVRYLPTSAKERSHLPADTISAAPLYHHLAIASIFVFFIGIGAIWAYLFLIGIDIGGSEQGVANGIMLSQIAAAVGALTAATLANRFGRVKPVTTGMLGCFIPLFLLFDATTMPTYVTIICLFNFSYNMTHPYLYATLASIDKSGRKISYAVAGQVLGMAFGPSLAASLVSNGDFSGVVYIAIIAFMISLLLVMPPLLNHRNTISQSVC